MPGEKIHHMFGEKNGSHHYNPTYSIVQCMTNNQTMLLKVKKSFISGPLSTNHISKIDVKFFENNVIVMLYVFVR